MEMEFILFVIGPYILGIIIAYLLFTKTRWKYILSKSTHQLIIECKLWGIIPAPYSIYIKLHNILNVRKINSFKEFLSSSSGIPFLLGALNFNSMIVLIQKWWLPSIFITPDNREAFLKELSSIRNVPESKNDTAEKFKREK